MSTPDKPKGPKLRPGMLSLETTPGVPLSFSGVTDSSLPYFHTALEKKTQKKPGGGLESRLPSKEQHWLPENPGLVPSTHVVAHNQIPVPGIWCLLLTSLGTRHACGVHT